MKKKLIVAGLIVVLGIIGFLGYIQFKLTDEVLVREDIRLGGSLEEVHAYISDTRNWEVLHRPRVNATSTFSDPTTGEGAWWEQKLATRTRKMTIESADLKGGVKFLVDYGGSRPLECHMAVRKHLVKGLIFVRSVRGKVSFFERLQRKKIQRRMREEIYYGMKHLEEKFGKEDPDQIDD